MLVNIPDDMVDALIKALQDAKTNRSRSENQMYLHWKTMGSDNHGYAPKILLIKAIRNANGLGLTECKKIIDSEPMLEVAHNPGYWTWTVPKVLNFVLTQIVEYLNDRSSHRQDRVVLKESLEPVTHWP